MTRRTSRHSIHPRHRRRMYPRLLPLHPTQTAARTRQHARQSSPRHNQKAKVTRLTAKRCCTMRSISIHPITQRFSCQNEERKFAAHIVDDVLLCQVLVCTGCLAIFFQGFLHRPHDQPAFDCDYYRLFYMCITLELIVRTVLLCRQQVKGGGDPIGKLSAIGRIVARGIAAHHILFLVVHSWQQLRASNTPGSVIAALPMTATFLTVPTASRDEDSLGALLQQDSQPPGEHSCDLARSQAWVALVIFNFFYFVIMQMSQVPHSSQALVATVLIASGLMAPLSGSASFDLLLGIGSGAAGLFMALVIERYLRRRFLARLLRKVGRVGVVEAWAARETASDAAGTVDAVLGALSDRIETREVTMKTSKASATPAPNLRRERNFRFGNRFTLPLTLSFLAIKLGSTSPSLFAVHGVLCCLWAGWRCLHYTYRAPPHLS